MPVSNLLETTTKSVLAGKRRLKACIEFHPDWWEVVYHCKLCGDIDLKRDNKGKSIDVVRQLIPR